jgi:cytochrome c oxidase subunit 5a
MLSNIITRALASSLNKRVLSSTRLYSSHQIETDEQFDAKWEAYFKRPSIDGWEVRKGINDMQGMDLFPEPKIVIAALEACKRINDHSLAVRYLEALKWKAGKQANVIYPWLIQEIRPTLNKLGISTPEELGYDKPELALKSVFEMKGPNDY